MRVWFCASSTATCTGSPRMKNGWLLLIFISVSLAIASMKPSPSVLGEMRNERIGSFALRSSIASGSVAREWMSDPPWESKKSPFDRWPARCTVTWLAPPVTMFWWHSRQLCAL